MPTTWNPSDKSSTHTLSNGNKTTAANSNQSGAITRAIDGISGTQKCYWETTGDSAPGLGPLSLSVNTYPGLDTASVFFPFVAGGLYYNAGVAQALTAPANPNSDRVCWEYDASTKVVKARVNNGAWVSLTIAGAASTMYPLTDIDSVPGNTTLFTAPADWLYSPDTGYGEINPPNGTLAATEASDTFSGSGTLGYSGSLAATEARDTFAGTGVLAYSGTLAATEAKDTFAGSGVLAYSGTLAATEASDTFSGSGSVAGVVSGTLAATEGADAFAGSGTLGYSGTLAATEANDNFAGSGVLEYSGSFAVTEGSDAFAGSGSVDGGDVTGTLDASEAPDTFAGVGTIPVSAPSGGGGGGRRERHQSRGTAKVVTVDDDELREIYERVTQVRKPAPIIKKAIAAVAQHAPGSAAKPEPAKVDWAKLAADIDAVEALVAAYEELDDEEAFILALLHVA